MTRRQIADVAAVCIFILTLALGWYCKELAEDVRQGQRDLLTAITQHPAASSALAYDYTDANGDPRHVEVSSIPGESPQALVYRLKVLVDEAQREFPRRR